jgi:hypothetical protein
MVQRLADYYKYLINDSAFSKDELNESEFVA